MKVASNEEIKKMLNESNEVRFTFKKKDGTIRIARGTTKHEVIEENGYVYSDGTSTRKRPENTIPFYDLEIKEWRSFSTLYNSDVNVYDEDETIEIPRDPHVEEMEKVLKKLMETDEVEFEFTKKDGSNRVAKGTRNADKIKNLSDIEIPETLDANGTISFFDIEKKDWRCLKEGTLVKINSFGENK